jgi:heat shock protein HtpX
MDRSTINYFKTATLFVAPAAIGAAFGYTVAGWLGLMLCAAACISLCLIVFLSADRIVLEQHRAGHIQEQQAPGLYAVVGQLARRAGVRRPAVYLLREAAPQMLVTGRSANRGSIGLSRGLLDLLSTEELAAVIAHAIHQVRSGETAPMTMVSGLAGGLVSLSNIFRLSNLPGQRAVKIEKHGGISADAFLWPLVAPFAAALIRATVYPSRLFRADMASVHLIGDPNPLYTALAKIQAQTGDLTLESVSPVTAHLFFYSPLSGEPKMNLFRTHPSITQRLDRLDAADPVVHHFERGIKRSSWRANRTKILSEERTNL